MPQSDALHVKRGFARCAPPHRHASLPTERRAPPTTAAAIAAACAIAGVVGASSTALADERGISFWVPGLFGSLAAVPQQPGWALTTVYFHDNVSAGGAVARSLELPIGRIPVSANVGLSGNVNANINLAFADPTYTFATPVLGGQATIGLFTVFGRVGSSLSANLSGTLATPFGTLPFSRSDSFSDAVTGFGDLYPQLFMRWNAGVNNYMTYVTGDIPVGAYDPFRISNIGIGHGAVDVEPATPISTRRPAMKSPACSALRTTRPILRPNTRTASTCISTGAPRSF
jgi:hypothetical protein